MIYPKPYLRNGIYYFKYTSPSGRRKQKSCDTSDPGKAIKFIINFIDNQGCSVLDSVTFKQLLEPWRTGTSNPRYERYKIEGKQYGLQQVRNIKYLLEHIKNHKIMKIKAANIKKVHALALRAWLLEDIPDKPQTINKILSSLRSIFSEHIYREELEYNPFGSVGNVAYTPGVKEILSPEQVVKLIDGFSDPTAKAVCSLLAYTGMRMGEVLALDWDQVKSVTISVTRAFKSGVADDIGLPKWGKKREILLSKIAHKSMPDRGIGLVYTVAGHRVYKKWFYDHFSDALKAAKVPKITPHSLRHTINSALLLSNISPYLIQKYLGWSNTASLTPVQEGYTHIKASDLQVVADAIDGIYKIKKKKASSK